VQNITNQPTQPYGACKEPCGVCGWWDEAKHGSESESEREAIEMAVFSIRVKYEIGRFVGARVGLCENAHGQLI
jgi:hypothetical protein